MSCDDFADVSEVIAAPTSFRLIPLTVEQRVALRCYIHDHSSYFNNRFSPVAGSESCSSDGTVGNCSDSTSQIIGSDTERVISSDNLYENWLRKVTTVSNNNHDRNSGYVEVHSALCKLASSKWQWNYAEAEEAPEDSLGDFDQSFVDRSLFCSKRHDDFVWTVEVATHEQEIGTAKEKRKMKAKIIRPRRERTAKTSDAGGMNMQRATQAKHFLRSASSKLQRRTYQITRKYEKKTLGNKDSSDKKSPRISKVLVKTEENKTKRIAKAQEDEETPTGKRRRLKSKKMDIFEQDARVVVAKRGRKKKRLSKKEKLKRLKKLKKLKKLKLKQRQQQKQREQDGKWAPKPGPSEVFIKKLNTYRKCMKLESVDEAFDAVLGSANDDDSSSIASVARKPSAPESNLISENEEFAEAKRIQKVSVYRSVSQSMAKRKLAAAIKYCSDQNRRTSSNVPIISVSKSAQTSSALKESDETQLKARVVAVSSLTDSASAILNRRPIEVRVIQSKDAVMVPSIVIQQDLNHNANDHSSLVSDVQQAAIKTRIVIHSRTTVCPPESSRTSESGLRLKQAGSDSIKSQEVSNWLPRSHSDYGIIANEKSHDYLPQAQARKQTIFLVSNLDGQVDDEPVDTKENAVCAQVEDYLEGELAIDVSASFSDARKCDSSPLLSRKRCSSSRCSRACNSDRSLLSESFINIPCPRTPLRYSSITNDSSTTHCSVCDVDNSPVESRRKQCLCQPESSERAAQSSASSYGNSSGVENARENDYWGGIGDLEIEKPRMKVKSSNVVKRGDLTAEVDSETVMIDTMSHNALDSLLKPVSECTQDHIGLSVDGDFNLNQPLHSSGAIAAPSVTALDDTFSLAASPLTLNCGDSVSLSASTRRSGRFRVHSRIIVPRGDSRNNSPSSAAALSVLQQVTPSFRSRADDSEMTPKLRDRAAFGVDENKNDVSSTAKASSRSKRRSEAEILLQRWQLGEPKSHSPDTPSREDRKVKSLMRVIEQTERKQMTAALPIRRAESSTVVHVLDYVNYIDEFDICEIEATCVTETRQMSLVDQQSSVYRTELLISRTIMVNDTGEIPPLAVDHCTEEVLPQTMAEASFASPCVLMLAASTKDGIERAFSGNDADTNPVNNEKLNAKLVSQAGDYKNRAQKMAMLAARKSKLACNSTVDEVSKSSPNPNSNSNALRKNGASFSSNLQPQTAAKVRVPRGFTPSKSRRSDSAASAFGSSFPTGSTTLNSNRPSEVIAAACAGPSRNQVNVANLAKPNTSLRQTTSGAIASRKRKAVAADDQSKQQVNCDSKKQKISAGAEDLGEIIGDDRCDCKSHQHNLYDGRLLGKAERSRLIENWLTDADVIQSTSNTLEWQRCVTLT